jgi:glycine betaine/proline transport system ATP-binding protein
MEPVRSFSARVPQADLKSLRRVGVRQPLGELVEFAAQDDAPLAVTDVEGTVVGVVDRQRLLNGLRKGGQS